MRLSPYMLHKNSRRHQDGCQSIRQKQRDVLSNDETSGRGLSSSGNDIKSVELMNFHTVIVIFLGP